MINITSLLGILATWLLATGVIPEKLAGYTNIEMKTGTIIWKPVKQRTEKRNIFTPHTVDE